MNQIPQNQLDRNLTALKLNKRYNGVQHLNNLNGTVQSKIFYKLHFNTVVLSEMCPQLYNAIESLLLNKLYHKSYTLLKAIS